MPFLYKWCADCDKVTLHLRDETPHSMTYSLMVCEHRYPAEGFCQNCKHALYDNNHGPDQGDLDWQDGKWVLNGTCIYCKFCNVALRDAG